MKAHDVVPECVIISKLNTANLDLTSKPNEIIVDPACGAAVLRGSHVFAPGVMGALPSKQETEVHIHVPLQHR